MIECHLPDETETQYTEGETPTMGNLFNPPRTAPYTLVGQNSNAYNLLGGWADAATKNGWSKEDIDKVIEEATSGDYENLLRVLTTHSIPE
jgi:hypothetical protein